MVAAIVEAVEIEVAAMAATAEVEFGTMGKAVATGDTGDAGDTRALDNCIAAAPVRYSAGSADYSMYYL